MSERINWGILSTAEIGTEKVIPGMQAGRHCRILGMASRDDRKAQSTSKRLGIERSYGSYEAMLDDPDIEAVYNPLPNHMHLEWTLKAIERGKHVLCEKPLVLALEDVRTLIAARDRHGVKVGEAFMVHTHPQWLLARKIIGDGDLGELKAIQGFFSYYNDDAQNIRNIADYGGGALWDIGVYPVHTSRFVLGEEPKRVAALLRRDPGFQTDVLSSVLVDYSTVQCSFQCGTLLVPHQSMQFFGDRGRLEIEIPFNAPPDTPCRMFLNGDNLRRERGEVLEVKTCDQYGVQGDVFSRAILDDTEVPVPLENSLWNTATILAIFRAAGSGRWESVDVSGS